ncbi:S-layer protein [Thermincola ferriacetica]|uniref:S-layer protein n=1 Tax=Thermincola ferriacetica TaxID=281456 RepID=A0A0L6W4C8_9FIRM|nr:S-layer homology domain-containing protein [Thermincola ferriacetica]KNZ70331.1 S-layer protein [Thermincola ferriacetica]
MSELRKTLTAAAVAAVLLFNAALPAAWAAVFTPPAGAGSVTKEDINYAESVWGKIKWDSSRVLKTGELLLTLPRVKAPYIWSVKTDTGRYVGLMVEWKTVYFGTGGQDMVLEVVNPYLGMGVYIDLVHTRKNAAVASDEYIYYPGQGLTYIPPGERVTGAVDSEGNITALYDLWGRPVQAAVYGPDLFPNRYVVLTDLAPGHWAYAPVSSMVARGYMRGYPDSRFLPDRTMTRAEFLAVVSRILQEKTPGNGEYMNKTAFADLNPRHWAAGAVNHVLGHIPPQDAARIFGAKFAPDRPVTRGETAAVLYSLLKSRPGFNLRNSQTFKDTAGTGFADAVAFCAANGMVSGYPDGTFRPGGTITRAEVAAVLNRVVGRL